MANTNEQAQERQARNRHNVALEPSIKEKGETMAHQDLRSFSNFLEWLITQEARRRELMANSNPETKTDEPKAQAA